MTATKRSQSQTSGTRCSLVNPNLEQAYREALLTSLDAPNDLCDGLTSEIHKSDNEPLACCANAALNAIRSLTPLNLSPDITGNVLLQERADLLKLPAADTISANRQCQLLQTANGWVALNLARQTDRELLPAWLESDLSDRSFTSIKAKVRQRSTQVLLTRGWLLGLPISAVNEKNLDKPWFSIQSEYRAHGEKSRHNPLVVDLSSLWAGPLCTNLLSLSGARVIKIESTNRPDGARLNQHPGGKTFFNSINSDKESVCLDLSQASGIAVLHQLLLRADIVIEASRPRALIQMGIEPEQILIQNQGLTWISITGYGRKGEQANRVAFGDDAAVSAGAFKVINNQPHFVGDAISDPLTGIHAALLALALNTNNHSQLVDINMHSVTAHCIHFLNSQLGMSYSSFPQKTAGQTFINRTNFSQAPPLGTHTKRVLNDFYQ